MTPPPSPSEPDREAAINAATSELIAQIEPAFEAVDHPRIDENNQYHRVVVDWFGYVEPFNPAADSWLSMPVRLVHSEVAGWHLEVGNLDFSRADIRLLRAAIAAYDAATRPAESQQ